MAGACPATLSIAVANAGGMGAMGALLTPPVGIRSWVTEFRSKSSGSFQLNVWIPDPRPSRFPDAEEKFREFLEAWGPPVPVSAGDAELPDFDEQCEAFLDLRPTAVSSIMGVFPAKFVTRLKDSGIAWFATATTLAEAKVAMSAGADAIIAQGYEAGGTGDRLILLLASVKGWDYSRFSRGSQIRSSFRSSLQAGSATGGA
jgi:nitronate monooxygenase